MRFWRKPFDHASAGGIPVKVAIKRERCKGCGFCVEFCPRGVLEMSRSTNSRGYLVPEVSAVSSCVDCGLCEVICPDFAICFISGKEVK